MCLCSILGGFVNKVYKSASEAIEGIADGMTIMSGGFGLCGNPENLIQAIYDKKVKDLNSKS